MRAYCRSCSWHKAHYGRTHVGAHWMRFQRPEGSTWTVRPCSSLPTEQDLVASTLWLWKGSVGRKLALCYVAPGSLSSGRLWFLWRWWTRCCWAVRYRAVTGRVAVTGDNAESHSRWQGCPAQEEKRLSLDLGRCSQCLGFKYKGILRVCDIDWALRRRQCDPQPCGLEASTLLVVGRGMFDELGAGG